MTVSIEEKHFIGSGTKAWLIVGRIPGDDDDTAHLVLADDELLAQEAFENQMFNDGKITEEDQKNITEQYGSSIIVTTNQLLN